MDETTGKLYKTIPCATGNNVYVLQCPAVVEHKDVLSDEWPQMKKTILQNITYLYSDSLDQLEKDVKSGV